jgi:hypothetical protein
MVYSLSLLVYFVLSLDKYFGHASKFVTVASLSLGFLCIMLLSTVVYP